MAKLQDLAKQLADKHLLDEKAAGKFVHEFFSVLNDGLQYEKQVKIKGLGTFKVTGVAPRESVDVNTGKRILIEGRDKIGFTPDATMRDAVNKPFAQFETVVVNDGVDFGKIDTKFSQDEDGAVAEVLGQTREQYETLKQKRSRRVEEPAAEVSTNPVVQTPVVPEYDVAYAKEEVAVSDPVPAENKVAQVGAPVSFRLDAADLTLLNGIAAEDRPADDGGSEEESPVLSLDSDMLDLLNGKEEDKPVKAEKSQETTTLVEEEKIAEPVIESDILESVNVDEVSASSVSQGDSDVAEGQKADKSRRLVKALAVTVVSCVVVLIGCGVYMANQLRLRDNRIAYLETQSATLQQKAKAKRVSVEKPVVAPSAAPQVVAEDGKQAASAASQSVDALPQAEAKSQEAPVAKTAVAPSSQVKEKEEADLASDYNKDVRVRTGAYRITGIARKVTVRKGQTLSSISRTHLGPGMECYVEAVNGEIKEVKEGQQINIPALKLKKVTM